MELSEKDKKAAVLILQESLHVLDERIGKGENPLSGDVAFTVHERVKEMAVASKGAMKTRSIVTDSWLMFFWLCPIGKEGAKGQRASRCNKA